MMYPIHKLILNLVIDLLKPMKQDCPLNFYMHPFAEGKHMLTVGPVFQYNRAHEIWDQKINIQ